MLGERFEKWYPAIFGFFCLALIPQAPWVEHHRLIISAAISKLFLPALNVSAIAIGFLATSQSILISLKDAGGIVQMKKDGYYDAFVNFISTATTSSFLLAILSGLFSALDFAKLDNTHGYMQVAWLALCFYTMASYYRAVSILPYVLRGTIPRCAVRATEKKPFRTS